MIAAMGLTRLLPLAPTGARLTWLLCALYVPAYLVLLAAGQTSEDLENWLLPAALLASAIVCGRRSAGVREDRAAWGLMAFAMATWACAEIVYATWIQHMDPEPFPSVADALWLIEYPSAALALLLMLRRRTGRLPVAFVLDGVMGAVTVGALGAMALAALPTGGATQAEVLTNAAYPVDDLLLCVLLVGALALGSLRLSALWVLIAASFVVQVLSDGAYLQQIASGTYGHGKLTDLGWYVGPALLAAAAWRPDRTVTDAGARWRSPAVGLGCGVVAIVLLIADHGARLPTATVALAGITLALLLARLGIVFRDHQRLLDAAQGDARTDALTGLGNRRALLADLEAACDAGTAGVLALYDLDGFKAYNDTFGHPAGDELLRRLGVRLGEVAAAAGARAYRLGGDEFCLLGPCAERDAAVLADQGRQALSDSGDGFRIGASGGWTALPAPEGPAAALADADRRMYAVKHGRRSSSGRQTADALRAAVAERHPGLGDHVGEVAALAVAVARRLGLPDRDVALVRDAAELHDVGKIAIPDAILGKPAALDEEEWRFMRRHTIIGARIMLAAPDLEEAAPLVRASHERWDGLGYPDGLAGEAIPLGARIVAVCDAFDAMVAERPYRPGRSAAAALAELRRCAGTQFDPAVVEAFAAVLAREAAGV